MHFLGKGTTMRDEQQRDRDNGRVTRRGGTKIFGSSSAPQEAERIRAFDDDRDRAPRGEMPRGERRYRDDDDRDYRESRRYRGDDDDRDYRESRRYRGDDDRDYRESRRYRDDDDRDTRESRRYRDDDDRDTRESRRTRDEGDRRHGDRDKERREAPRGGDKPRASKPKASPRAGAANTELFAHQVVPYVMFWIALFAAVSFVLRDIAGLSASAGAFGNWLADFLCGLLGIGAYFLPLFFIVISLRWKRFVREGILGKKLFLSASFLLLLSGIIHVFQDVDRARRVSETAILYAQGVARDGGGFFGGFVGELLGFCLRLSGTCLLAIPLLIIVGIYLVGLTPSGLHRRIGAKLKMMRQRGREERGTAGARITPHKENKTLPSGTEQGAPDWKEPRPLSRSAAAYEFREDEPEIEVEEKPARHEAPKAASVMQNTARARRAAEVNDLLDIPDDEPEIVEPSPGAQAILSGAGQGDDAGRQVEELLREMERAATEAPAAPKAAATGDYYAPFALPIRPEPRRERANASAFVGAFDATAKPSADAAPVAASGSDDMSEESLGSMASAARPEPVASTPYRAPAYENPAQAYRGTPVLEEEPDEGPFESKPIVVESHGVEAESSVSFGPSVAPFLEEVEEDDDKSPEALFDFDKEDDPAQDDAILAASVTPHAPDRNPFAADHTFGTFDTASTDRASDMPVELFEEPAISPVEEPVAWTRREIPAPTAQNPAVREPVAALRPGFAPAATPSSTPAATVTPVKDEPPAPIVHRPYTRPHVGLLAIDQNVRTSDFYEEIEDTKAVLRDTLESFNIHIQDQISYSHGPSVTRYELRPVAGTSVRSVTNRIDDIALNLAAAVRIEAPIPGKPAIGIEVPNKVRETVYMRTMLESDEYRTSTKPLEVPLGLDVGGAVRMCDLSKMPHLLIAGTTGSGKSVCINAILMSLIFKTSPEDLRLILIDPKQIEFAPYEHVPHLYMPIVTDMQRAAGALACAVQEMERRFSLIKDVGVRNIESYNEAVKNDPDREHLPYIIIVIDEFADLKMSVTNNDPENFTCRIAQKARAAGIHLIIGTQRPSVDVITGKLKTNIPSRIAFMVKQQVDSRTILDVNGAESLTGRGDMLYMASNSQDKAPVRVQGAYVSDKELEDVIGYVRSHNDPVQYNRAFMDQIEIEVARAQNNGKKSDVEDFGDAESIDGEDPKFVEAVKLAIETQKVATSLLQRRLGVGYGRAAKIIDRMEDLGLVSAPDGNKPRQILPAAQGYLNHLGAEEEDGNDDFNDYR